MTGGDHAEWVSPKRRPVPQGITSTSVEVSRQSGLVATSSTFGGSARFSNKLIGRGKDSPRGREFYGRNQMWNRPGEEGSATSLGFGERGPTEFTTTPKTVGPGSYEIVASAVHHRSPLDGREFCTLSMARKLPSTLVPLNTCSPGPNKYEVSKPFLNNLPTYGLPAMSRGGRQVLIEKTEPDGPELAYNDLAWMGMARSATAPAGTIGGPLLDKKPSTKSSVKCTFGMSERFPKSKQSCSPSGDLYYAHAKFLTSEDYLSQGKSCTFGAGQKVDLSNPFRSPQNSVSPASYSPIASITRKTSSLDGLISRCPSPIHTFCRAMKTPPRPAHSSLGQRTTESSPPNRGNFKDNMAVAAATDANTSATAAEGQALAL